MRIENVKYEVIKEDKSDLLSKVVITHKPIGVTSHDVVDYMRGELNTRKVGHAGTLDPFAEGELIIASGKYTKTLNQYLELPKIYTFKAIIGVKTISGDNQEVVSDFNIEYIKENIFKLNLLEIKEKIIKIMDKYKENYIQTVPVFSSVKVGGNKLRELARNNTDFKIVKSNELSKDEVQNISTNLLVQEGDEFNKNDERSIVIFKKGNSEIKVLIPRKECKIYEYKDIDVRTEDFSMVNENSSETFKESLNNILKESNVNLIDKILIVSGSVTVESGTYVRTLVEDILNNSLNSLGTLFFLSRKYDLSKLKD